MQDVRTPLSMSILHGKTLLYVVSHASRIACLTVLTSFSLAEGPQNVHERHRCRVTRLFFPFEREMGVHQTNDEPILMTLVVSCKYNKYCDGTGSWWA